MMADARPVPHLIDRLPRVRGRLTADAPLAAVTWFRVGGQAEVLFRPADVEDLAAFLAALPDDIPVTVLGVASNLLVRDGGVRGVVIRLLRGFVDVRVEGTADRRRRRADLSVALVARDHGVAGLEFLSGVPGTIGGALRMNAGAYGGEMKDIVEQAEMVGRDAAADVSAAELGFTYRHTAAIRRRDLRLRHPARARGRPG